MKPNKELLDDLMTDSVLPEFRATLMAKTLQSARQRKRARHFRMTLIAAASVGVIALAFQKMRAPKFASNPIRQPILSVASSPPAKAVQVASAKPASSKIAVVSDSSDSTYSVVETTAADRPREINDQELLALVGNKPVALIHESAHKAKLILLNSGDEKGVPVQ